MRKESCAENSATGTRTRVARVRAEYPNQLDYSGAQHQWKHYLQKRKRLKVKLRRSCVMGIIDPKNGKQSKEHESRNVMDCLLQCTHMSHNALRLKEMARDVERITPCGARTHDLWLIRPLL